MGGMDGSELQRRRKALGLSQSELGERIGIRQPSISAWEQGHKPIGNPRMLALALWALERQADDEREWCRRNEYDDARCREALHGS
jgi:transcriptional regulator with XRE-family HTH domain